MCALPVELWLYILALVYPQLDRRDICLWLDDILEGDIDLEPVGVALKRLSWLEGNK